jgi:cytidylate kinase
VLHFEVVSELTIAIDGPSGVGKGTLARRLAEALGYRHIDTGAMYRAVAWKAQNDGLSLDDEAAVAALAERVGLSQEGGVVTIDGHDVTRAIRTPEIDRASTVVARLPGVRAALVARQQQLGAGGGVVMEGRDIGTVVFPNADVKVYLDASADERARRRANDPAHTGGSQASVEGLRTAMAARDQSDQTRTVSPLQIAADAVYVDTTALDLGQVFEAVNDIVEQARAARR